MKKNDANLMNANNLAVVFGPNLAWARNEPTSLTHMHSLNNFAYLLITHHAEIFSA